MLEEERESIIRELAHGGPYTNDSVCVFCDVDYIGRVSLFVGEPGDHESSCLWRRARALYPEYANA